MSVSLRIHQTLKYQISLLCTSFMLLNTYCLGSGGVWKNSEAEIIEEIAWDAISFSINQVYFTASIPNYLETTIENNQAFVHGEINKASYGIIAWIDHDLLTYNSLEEFSVTSQKVLASAKTSRKLVGGLSFLLDKIS